MTTETAQRRLLEALATLRNTPGLDHGATDSPLASVAFALRILAAALQSTQGAEEVAVASIHAAVADLAEAVDNELRGVRHD